LNYKFKKHENIGQPAAEMDDQFLSKCFFDNGDLSVLLDTEDPRMIVLGRTGSGKSAILLEVKRKHPKNTFVLNPEALSVEHVATNEMITFFEDLGVRLDVFYKLLWKHVIVLEVIKLCFEITNEDKKQGWIQRYLMPLKRDKKKQKSIKYLEDWSNKFWDDSEYRIKEITQNFDKDLRAGAAAALGQGTFSLEAGISSSTEIKADIIKRGKQVVNSLQMKDLDGVVSILAEDLLTNDQKKFYLTIDKLDEDWVGDDIKYKLIKALFEALKDLSCIKNVKILVSMRRDLMDYVFKNTRGAGHQQEKYDSLCLNLQWSETELEKLLDARINELIQRRYTKKKITLAELLPKKIERNQPSIRYLMDRTFLRPRDAITFMNYCIAKCIDHSKFTATCFRQAEKDYSEDRFKSLSDEWQLQYPNLRNICSILENRPSKFFFTNIKEDDILDAVCNYPTDDKGELNQACSNYIADTNVDRFLQTFFSVLYRVGLIGIKSKGSQEVQWSYRHSPVLSASELEKDTKIYIHKTFWAALGVKQPNTGSAGSE